LNNAVTASEFSLGYAVTPAAKNLRYIYLPQRRT